MEYADRKTKMIYKIRTSSLIKTLFSDKSKTADAKWRIETFRQEKKHIANFIIEFEALVMKAEIDDIYTIFLLKKNVRDNIVKITLGYLLMVALELLKEWKVVIILVKQEYESTEGRQDYRIKLETIYEGKVLPMEIGKENCDKGRKFKCFNCNIYRYIARNCRKPKKKRR